MGSSGSARSRGERHAPLAHSNRATHHHRRHSGGGRPGKGCGHSDPADSGTMGRSRTVRSGSSRRTCSRSERSRSAVPSTPSATWTKSVRARGVVAYSSGNHAQAVAYAAAAVSGRRAHRDAGETPARESAGHPRLWRARRALWTWRAREGRPRSWCKQTGGVLIPPFDHPDVIAGQGTIGLEIADDLPDVENVLIPVSGGGLASGIGTAIKAKCPNAKVFGVEPELAADTAEGLRRGQRVDWSDRGPQPHHRRRPAIATLRADLRASAERDRRDDHGVGERDSRRSPRTCRQGSPGQRAQWRGCVGRLSAGCDTAGPNGNDSVRGQRRTGHPRRHPGGLKLGWQCFGVCCSGPTVAVFDFLDLLGIALRRAATADGGPYHGSRVVSPVGDDHAVAGRSGACTTADR